MRKRDYTSFFGSCYLLSSFAELHENIFGSEYIVFAFSSVFKENAF